MAPEGLHLEARDVSAYVDHALSDVERARVEAHLVECAECRREVVEVSRLRRGARPRRIWLILPAAAAAAIAFALLRPQPTAGPELRDDHEHRLAVSIIAPAESVAASGLLRFIWRSAGADASYRLTLTDGKGDVLWSTSVSDTVAQLPPQIPLLRDHSYFWYVDALLSDGRSASSGMQRLETRH